MEQLLRPIYQERASSDETLGVVLVEKRREHDPVTDTFDAILLIVTMNDAIPIYTKHYTDGIEKAAMHMISQKQLMKWVLLGTRRKVVDWLYHGKVLFDRNEFIESLKQDLQKHPNRSRDIKMGIELSKLIRDYMEGKMFYAEENYFDAYHHVVKSLHHLARLTVIEQGLLPEVTVWSQVKKFDPAIYKLYEELVLSDESLEKRLKLLFLASDFFIHNRTTNGAKHILSVMKQKEKWTIQELHEEEELKMYSVDLEVLMEYLIEKELIHVVPHVSKGGMVFHREYTVQHLS